MKLHKKTCYAMAITVVFAIWSSAAVPELITYQGRLTNTSGTPVADGLYLIQFRIYDAESGGITLWDNGFRTIQVTGGLFTYSLGDSTIFPVDLFDGPNRWLGTRVGVDPELTPRKQLVSSPYSLRSSRADAVSNDSEFVHVLGDEMNGNLNFDIGNDGDIELVLYTSLGRGQFSMLDNGNQRIFLGSQAGGGSMIIQDNATIFSQLSGDHLFGGGVFHTQGDGTLGAELVAGSGISESHLRLYDNTGAPTVALFGNSTGDGAALLPDNSVNSTEILDNTISAADIGVDAVGSSEIVSGGVIGGDIADGTIMNVDVGVGAIDGTRIADNTLSGTDVTDGTLNSADIANNTLTTDDILDNTLAAVDIAPGGVASSEILDGSVSTVDITDNSITAADIADGSIITADLATGGVTTSDIADGGVALVDLQSGIVPAVGSTDLTAGFLSISALVPTTADSFTVVSPGTGYLLVTVSGQYYFDLDAPASTHVVESGAFGLCTTANSSASCGGTWELRFYEETEDASTTTANQTLSFTLQRLIPVIATSYTFYLNGQATSGGSDLVFYEGANVTALFVPASLTVTSAPAVPGTPDLEQK